MVLCCGSPSKLGHPCFQIPQPLPRTFAHAVPFAWNVPLLLVQKVQLLCYVAGPVLGGLLALPHRILRATRYLEVPFVKRSAAYAGWPVLTGELEFIPVNQREWFHDFMVSQ